MNTNKYPFILQITHTHNPPPPPPLKTKDEENSFLRPLEQGKEGKKKQISSPNTSY